MRRNRLKGLQYKRRTLCKGTVVVRVIKGQQNERSVKQQLKEHIDKTQRQRAGPYREDFSNSEDEKDEEPTEQTIGHGKEGLANLTLRSAFIGLQLG